MWWHWSVRRLPRLGVVLVLVLVRRLRRRLRGRLRREPGQDLDGNPRLLGLDGFKVVFGAAVEGALRAADLVVMALVLALEERCWRWPRSGAREGAVDVGVCVDLMGVKALSSPGGAGHGGHWQSWRGLAWFSMPRRGWLSLAQRVVLVTIFCCCCFYLRFLPDAGDFPHASGLRCWLFCLQAGLAWGTLGRCWLCRASAWRAASGEGGRAAATACVRQV